jgi:hypothetical protein
LLKALDSRSLQGGSPAVAAREGAGNGDARKR